jgi:MFS superfamily sulfate permease-like transporter
MQFAADGSEEPVAGCQWWCHVVLYYSPLAVPFYLLAMVLFLLLTVFGCCAIWDDDHFHRQWFQWQTIKVIMGGCYMAVVASAAGILLFLGVLLIVLVGLLAGIVLFLCAVLKPQRMRNRALDNPQVIDVLDTPLPLV